MGTYDDRVRHYKLINDNRNLVAVNRAVSAASIQIKIGNIGLGYIQSYTGNQARGATPLYEVGSVGIVEHMVGQPTYNLTIARLAVYRLNFIKIAAQAGMQAKNEILYNAIVARLDSKDQLIDFNAITEHAIPFDIVVKQKDPASEDQANAATLKTTWIDCIITAWSETVNASGNLTIAENLTIVARRPNYSQSGISLNYPS